ncbi:MAG TPA: TetR/AcrR family transcriptional regulator [Actinomycetota bacterium]|nr:TetR/AcrR family transcriptional regulator [Actinomycetota bacterium]
MTLETPLRARQTQAGRRARTRSALLESAARGLSRDGYGNLVLEKVARDAGYTRGALYHQFANKEDLALAVVAWVEENWWAEMGKVIADNSDPLQALIDVARTHAVFCRRDIARVHMVLSIEFSGQDHPVGRAIDESSRLVIAECARLITAGRKSGTIPSGPPPKVVASALMGAVEGLVINLAGQAPFDEELAGSVVAGVLGLQSAHKRRDR